MDVARYRAAEDRLWASLGAAPAERWVHLPRTRVRVRVLETGEGPAVVFLHGGSISGTSWAPLVARLDGFRCVLVDRPGCGLSDPLEVGFDDVQRLGEFADDLVVDLLDALGLEHAPVIATSFGGYLGLRSAAAHPDRVDRLLLFGFSVGAPIRHTPLVMRVGSVPWVVRLMAKVPPTERMARSVLKGIGLRDAVASGRVTPEMVGWFLSLLRDTDTLSNEVSSLPRIMTMWRGMNERVLLPSELLGQITVPTHLLWGESDPFGGADTAREFAAHLPNADLEMMPGGHAVWMDDAERVAAVTGRFLAA